MLKLISSGEFPPIPVAIMLAVMGIHAIAVVWALWCWRSDVKFRQARQAERRRRATVRAGEEIRKARAQIRPSTQSNAATPFTLNQPGYIVLYPVVPPSEVSKN